LRALVVAPLYHPDRGGLGRQAVLLSEGLAARGVEVTVATRAMSGLPTYPFSPRVERVELSAGRPDVHNYERPSPTNLLTSLRFSAQLGRLCVRRRRRFDLVHFHGASLPLLSTLPLLAGLGKRVIAKVAALHQGVEAGDLSGHYGPLGPLMAASLRRVDAFVATTAEIEQALISEGYRAERIARISNFVETARFAPPTPEARSAARTSSRTICRISRRSASRPSWGRWAIVAAVRRIVGASMARITRTDRVSSFASGACAERVRVGRLANAARSTGGRIRMGQSELGPVGRGCNRPDQRARRG